MNWFSLLELLGAVIIVYIASAFVLSASIVERERRKAPGASRKVIALNTRHAILRNGFLLCYFLPVIVVKFLITAK